MDGNAYLTKLKCDCHRKTLLKKQFEVKCHKIENMNQKIKIKEGNHTTVQGLNLSKNHGMMGRRSCETIFSMQTGHILLIA